MKNLLALLTVLVSAISLHAQVAQVVVSGWVRDAYSETVLIHSNVDNGWGIVGALATERHTIRF